MRIPCGRRMGPYIKGEPRPMRIKFRTQSATYSEVLRRTCQLKHTGMPADENTEKCGRRC